MANMKYLFLALLTLTILTTVCSRQSDFVIALPANYDPSIDTVFLDSAREDRIVGGEEATKNEFPGIVNLIIAKAGGAVTCGGNIVNASWIFTAAHCIWPLENVRGITVTAGDHYRNQKDPTEQIRDGKRMFVLGSYDTTTFADDIALVELATPFTINEYVQQSTLANPDYFATGPAIVAGWGMNRNNGTVTNELRKANVTFVSNDICSQNFGNAIQILSSMVCASAPNRGVCNGDSGGPIMVRSQITNGLFLAGIADFVDVGGCGNDVYPDVFQRVSSHLDWIQSYVKNIKIDPGLPPTTKTERISTTTNRYWDGNGVEKMSTNVIAQFVMFVVLYRNVIAYYLNSIAFGLL